MNRSIVCSLLGLHMWAISSSEPLLLPLITGRLMVVPKTELQPDEVVPAGMVRVWAYNKDSENWSKRGYPLLDNGKIKQRFPSCLPYASLVCLIENSLYIFEKNGKEFMLTCANLGTRYGDRTFEQQVRLYAVFSRFDQVSS